MVFIAGYIGWMWDAGGLFLDFCFVDLSVVSWDTLGRAANHSAP